MEPVIQEFVDGIVTAATSGDKLAGLIALGVGLMGIIRVIRLDPVQNLLGRFSPKALWKTWPKKVRFILPLACGAAGGVIVALASGQGVGGAIAGAITGLLGSGLTSVGSHHATEKVGELIDKRRLKKDPTAKPGWARMVASLGADITPAHKLGVLDD